MSEESIKKFIQEAPVVQAEELKNLTSETNKSSHVESVLSDYVLNEQGLFYDGKHLCSPIEVIARTRDENNDNWGRVVRFRDPDGYVHEHAISMESLRGDGIEPIGRLLSWGLIINPGRTNRQKLLEYIQVVPFTKSATCVSRVGWYGNIFILPDTTIPFVEDAYLQNNHSHSQGFQTKGGLEEWQDHVAKPCQGNSRLVFALSCAFAAPLFPLVNAESGGFNLKGASSTGKSTALNVAASVWGSPQYVQQWRTTGNALEAVAEAHNHTLLCLDELGQVDGKEAGEIAYMLANGSGKNRLSSAAELKNKRAWQLLFLSTGEISIADKMCELGKKVQAGMLVRMIDIPADAEKGHRLFDTLHDFQDGNAMAHHLKQVTTQHYGTPIRAYLSKLIPEKDTIVLAVNELKNSFLGHHIKSDMDGQVQRAADRFALLAAAGELAIRWGILPYNEGDAIKALGACFRAWLDERGSVGNYEAEEGVRQVQAFIEAHYSSRFVLISDNGENKILNQAGYRKVTDADKRYEFYIFPAVFEKEVCKGHNPMLVKRALAAKDLLVRDSEGKYVKPVHVPGLKGKKRMIHLTADILADKNA